MGVGCGLMAKFTYKPGKEYMAKLSKLSAGADEIAKKAIYKGAGIVADSVRTHLHQVLGESETSTGDLEASLGISPIQQDANGDWNAKVSFSGYDRKGVPNQLKARVLESGTSSQRMRPRPFVRPAVNATKVQAKEAMDKVIDEEIKKIMK